MSKTLRKTNKRDTVKAARILRTAELTGLSPRQVRRVINGECENGKVLDVYMELSEGENLLVEAVKNAVPLN